MKVNVTNILLVVMILLLGWTNIFNNNIEPQPINITIPSTSGTTGDVNLEPKVTVDTVYLPSKEKIVVDSKYRELYEKTTDSIKKLNLYLKSIQIRDYDTTFVDNEEVLIKGKIKTRGSLLGYKVDYTIKETSFTYTPKVISQLPKLSLGVGIETGIPTVPTSNFLVKGNISLMNRQGHEISGSYDSDNRVWVGYKKTFKILK